MTDSPIVDVVIPVYNAAQHLEECLESVLAQTYSNWRATVVNNCSTDGTGRIADQFARRDQRLRVVHCSGFIAQSANYNRAVASASSEAKYIKILEADNWITDDAIERMVRLAEQDPQIGIVGSYYLFGNDLGGSGLPYSLRVMPGQKAVRSLFNGIYLLGAPSALLFRSEALRQQETWFREGIFYDDFDLCCRILINWKYGFVHRLLSFQRIDEQSALGKIRQMDFVEAYRYFLAENYGRHFFSERELPGVRQSCKRDYYGRLGRAIAKGKFFGQYSRFHRSLFAAEKKALETGPLLRAAGIAIVDLVLNPKSTVEGMIRQLRGRSRTAT